MSSRIKPSALALLAFAGVTLLGGLAGELVFAGLNRTPTAETHLHLGATPVASVPDRLTVLADRPSSATASAPAYTAARQPMFLGAPDLAAGAPAAQNWHSAPGLWAAPFSARYAFQPWGWGDGLGARYHGGFDALGWSGDCSPWGGGGCGQPA